MVEELDKEFEDKMAALVKEKQEKRLEIAEKVRVKKEKQAKVGQSLLNKLKKEHKAEEEEVVAEMLKQADEEGEEKEEGEERTSPPTPDCPICYEPMTPPTRIFQCGAGHLVCGACKPKLQVFHLVHHYFVDEIKLIQNQPFSGVPKQMWFSSWRASCGDGELCCSNLGQLLRTCVTCRIRFDMLLVEFDALNI